jgi:hypothetical protein
MFYRVKILLESSKTLLNKPVKIISCAIRHISKFRLEINAIFFIFFVVIGFFLSIWIRNFNLIRILLIKIFLLFLKIDYFLKRILSS